MTVVYDPEKTHQLKVWDVQYRDDPAPLDETCSCPTCRNYSRAYLRHLFTSGEILAMRLNTYHNLFFYQQLMAGLRDAISGGRLGDHVASLGLCETAVG